MFTKFCIDLSELYEKTLGKLSGLGAVLVIAFLVVLFFMKQWMLLALSFALLTCEVVGEVISEKKERR